MSPREGPHEIIRSLDTILGIRGSTDCGRHAGWRIVLRMAPPALRSNRQVVRLRTLPRRLKNGGHPSVHDFAARFHTRRETIYRDLRTVPSKNLLSWPQNSQFSGTTARSPPNAYALQVYRNDCREPIEANN